MSWESIANEYLIPVWPFGFLFWMLWSFFKINVFSRQTWRQKAISNPQLRRLRIQLLIATSILFFSGFSLFLAPSLSVFNFEGIFRTSLFCLMPMILWTFGILQIQISKFQLKNFPFTDQVVVPIPKPLQPPPHDARSYDDLSKELEKAMKNLEENG